MVSSTLRFVAIRLLRLARSHGGLLLVLGVALAERLAFLRWWRAFPGGDTYNFILIAQELLRGSYPIAEKRLPVYPLLIALAHGALDWEAAAIAVAVTASLAAIVLLYAIGRTLGLSKTALVVGLLPFQAVAPFLFQSVRGYADTTFVTLMLGAILGLLRMRTPRHALATGLLTGAAALTRPEGLALMPTLLLLSAFRPPLLSSMKAVGNVQKRRYRTPLAFTAAALAPLVLFALLSLRVGRPLLPTEYLKDAEAEPFGADTVQAYAANLWKLWQGVGVDRLWGEPLRLLRDATTTSLAALPDRASAFLTDPKEFPSLLLLAGLLFLLAKRRTLFLLTFAPFLAVSLAIAWWWVHQRFLVVLTPLPYLLLSAGTHVVLTALGSRRWASPPAPGGLARTLQILLAVALLALALGPWRFHAAAEAREVYGRNWGTGYAYYQAIQEARRLPGTIAFEHRSSITLALFGEPDRGRAVFADTHLATPDPAEQWAALERWNVRYLVVRGTTSDAFPVLTDSAFRDRFVQFRQFEHPQRRRGTDRATLYERRE